MVGSERPVSRDGGEDEAIFEAIVIHGWIFRLCYLERKRLLWDRKPHDYGLGLFCGNYPRRMATVPLFVREAPMKPRRRVDPWIYRLKKDEVYSKIESCPCGGFKQDGDIIINHNSRCPMPVFPFYCLTVKNRLHARKKKSRRKP